MLALLDTYDGSLVLKDVVKKISLNSRARHMWIIVVLSCALHFITYLHVILDKKQQEFSHVLPSLLSKNRTEEISARSLSHPTTGPGKLPCFKRKSITYCTV